ncbi:MAG: hypothetical protein LIO71_06300 [Ruminococcus sp.]|nr:hypothetical protein [Ruminococcus sp.]MCD7799759.1 hypothetical protein [Ruminococcus sp.]
MELICILIFSAVVVFICIMVIKVSFVEAEAEKHSLTIFFLKDDVENPESLLKQLYASYYGKIVIVNVNASEECCSICRLLCEENSHLTYCEFDGLNDIIKQECITKV